VTEEKGNRHWLQSALLQPILPAINRSTTEALSYAKGRLVPPGVKSQKLRLFSRSGILLQFDPLIHQA